MTPTTAIRTMIVDDEPLARTNLIALLRDDAEIVVVRECASGTEAIEAIALLRPELLFLDVQMPGCDGFEVLERVGTAAGLKAVVFVTAYDQYAVRAFEAAAVDYLLKPFDNARFGRALERAKALVRGQKADHLIVVKSAGRVTVVKTSEIEWVEAADYYACLHVKGRTHLLRRSLAELESELDEAMFCRIHRSTIVNLREVAEMRLDVNGEYEVVLREGTRLRLSRSYREQLQERLRLAVDRLR